MGLDAAIAVARLAESAGGAVLFGAALLLRLAAVPPSGAPWSRPLLGAAALTVGAGSLLALATQTIGMAGSVHEGLAPGALGDVLGDTGFGRSVLVRLAAAGAAGAVLILDRRGRAMLAALAALGAVALASLAWSGHGASDEGVRGAVHLAGDVAHLLAAGAWLGALAALVGLSLAPKPADGGGDLLAAALAAFSNVGVGVVAVLLLSGLANAWFLVGPEHWRTLAADPWGRLLLLKLLLFALMLGLAALNRWRLAPGLDGRGGGESLGALRASVAAEAVLGLGVLAAAAAMGGLAPPVSQG